MSAFISKIMAFIMSIMYFLGSYGIGTNDPVTIKVTDGDGNAVANASVCYIQYGRRAKDGSIEDVIDIIPIGTTDENGEVQWENQKYGEQTIVVYAEGTEGEEAPIFGDAAAKVNISRTKNEVVYITLAAEAATDAAA